MTAYRSTPRTTRAMLAASLGLALSATTAQADVQATGATDGVSIDNPAAGVTNITAPDNAIIDYARFNVGVGESVNFIQPSAAARVLNRINSDTPSQINGTINANGVVYFVNPAGVRFGPNSVVNVSGLYAVAGNLSNEDFTAGVNNFTDVAGNISAAGVIRADTIAALIGRSVDHTGTISVPEGTAVLAAGDNVLIGNPRGGLMVSVEADPITGEGGVNQDGDIDAADLSLVAGDLFSLAMSADTATARTPSDKTPDKTVADVDTDGDGDVDLDDINTAYANFTGPLPPGTGGKSREQGDTDGDGDVDNSDIATLFILFTGPITTPPPTAPPTTPTPLAGDFNLRVTDDVEFTPITENVNLTAADLSILRDQLGITARDPLPQERVEKAQSRALYNDLPGDGQANEDGSISIANTRLDADVVREALGVYREQLAVEGVTPAQRVEQLRTAVTAVYNDYAQTGAAGESFDAQAFVAYLRDNNPAMVSDLQALEKLRQLTLTMGLSEREKANSERAIIERTRPEAISYDQMKTTLNTAASLPEVEAADETDEG